MAIMRGGVILDDDVYEAFVPAESENEASATNDGSVRIRRFNVMASGRIVEIDATQEESAND